MKKDLRSGFRSNVFKDEDKAKEIYKDLDQDKVRDVKKIYKEYAGKDEGELKERLFEMAKQGREDGSLNDDAIDNMAKRIAPMLDGEKREKLNSLIAMMKNNQY